ncbi:hypothetical protein [Hymenobacter jeollabukensis]|uniref:Uncharacterized protein n=1 Tax=Hymenobacter jeollabukensis TaxID=2025313 RepID=A0A5R8WJZ9_9BACT|nr:hypothetical protein [Hymenobacter jeollabukensis]TLM89166.1 hypothetical protein FDY95_21590 [Hymenobacter jeollabukensis]
MSWHFLGSCLDGESFLISGLDVWQHPWRSQPESATVTDPIYGVSKVFGVYAIGPAEAPVRFAAGEFSNCVWGFYRPTAEQPADQHENKPI